MLRLSAIILTFCIFFFYACKKEESLPSLVFGKTFYKEKIEKDGKIRLFANSGEISDAATISRFETDSYSYLSTYTDYYVQGPKMDSLIFVNDKTARIVDDYVSRIFDYSQLKNDIILTQKDTTIFSIYGDLYSNSLIYQVGKYKPAIYSEDLVSSVGGEYLFTAKGKGQYVFNSNANVISTPLIGMVQYSRRSTRIDLVNNIFDAAFAGKIPLTDTVVVQLYTVTYQ
jgi:hypothetical protein